MSADRTNEIEEAASDWLVRRESAQWTASDQVGFEQWLDASTLHRVAFLRLEVAWSESARLKALGAGLSGNEPPPPGQWNLTPFLDRRTPDCAGMPAAASVGRGLMRRLAVAAGALLVIGVGLASYQFWGGDADRYRTPVGGLSSVPMRDGSKITLNTASEIRVSLSETERHIELRHGEAFFEVAKDSGRPFVVEAGKRRIVAVGTMFSVRLEGESVEIIVTEGKVRVEDASGPPRIPAMVASRSPVPSPSADDPVFLAPGAIAFAGEAGVLVQQKTVEEAQTHLSWRSGVLVFRDRTLADAVTEFNRYNVRQVVINDPAVAALNVEGNFRAHNVEAFVRLLERGFPVRASVEPERIVLGSR